MVDLLELRGLNAWYGAKQVLYDVSVSLQARGCTVLLGPCGTGKSTLLRCMDAFSRTQVVELKEGEWLAQRASTLHVPEISVGWGLQKPQRPAGNTLQFFCEGQTDSAAQVMQALREMFKALEVSDLLPLLLRETAALSAGEWALLNVLRAAYRGPHAVLLDEPTSALSGEEVDRMLALIAQIAKTRSVWVITHHLGHAQVLADQVILMGNGRVLETAQASHFFEQPQTVQARYFVQFGTLPEQRQSEDAPDDVQTRALFSAAIAELSAHRVPHAGPTHPLLPSRFRWVVGDRLAGVSIPGLLQDVHQDLQGLQGVGITTLLNLTESPFDEALARQYGMTSLFFPIPDMEPPASVEQALELCELLDAQLRKRTRIAVHCKAGQGRTGTVLALFMMWRNQGRWTGAQAVAAMRRVDPGWIQSGKQVLFLEQFHRFVVNNVTFTE